MWHLHYDIAINSTLYFYVPVIWNDTLLCFSSTRLQAIVKHRANEEGGSCSPLYFHFSEACLVQFFFSPFYFVFFFFLHVQVLHSNFMEPVPVNSTIGNILRNEPYLLEVYKSKEDKLSLLESAISSGDGNAIIAVRVQPFHLPFLFL